ncbi:MAG: hypothetical protein H6707_01560 [Deltaproteobacteria bacterium]|nr:hypothetical protein [Deltaproteobacteria bacterium]
MALALILSAEVIVRKRSCLFVVVLTFGLGACGQGLISEVSLDDIVQHTIGSQSWTIEADRVTGLAGPILSGETVFYPNALELLGTLTVHLDAQGIWTTYQGERYAGILPYRLLHSSDTAGDGTPMQCLEVKDSYDNQVVERACSTRVGEFAALSDSAPNSETLMLQTAQAVTDKINVMLAGLNFSTRVKAPTLEQLLRAAEGIRSTSSVCQEVLRRCQKEYNDDVGDSTDHWSMAGKEAAGNIPKGRVKMAQLTCVAQAATCKMLDPNRDTTLGRQTFSTQPTLPPPESPAAQAAAEAAVKAAGSSAVDQVCSKGGDQGGSQVSPPSDLSPIDSGNTGGSASIPVSGCDSSPLVLDLAGDGLLLKPASAGTQFALLNPAEPVQVGWLAGSDDALLALDRNDNGLIDDGSELFGDASGYDGFAALARYDDNHDGTIDASDAIFDRLLLWRDNGDGRSQPDELMTLRSAGVRALSLRHSVGNERSAGNLLGLIGQATDDRGQTIPLYDVYFALHAH